ncbi:MAG: leucine-rich repeat domain-containing protein [Waterburya sp.]
MVQTLTWLHLSDLHACKPRTGWDAKRVTDTLCQDLQKMHEQYGLKPDLIFFTGDAAYGHMGNDGGKSITEQFCEAHDFLTAVRESFQPAIAQRNLFLVPGNHDVNRTKISRFEQQALESIKSLDEITSVVKDTGIDWQRIICRLDDYAHFLQTYGYDHLLTGKEHLIYADAREIGDLRVGIAGFNSAWSSPGNGRLWMAGRFQLETLLQKLPKNDFAIALLPHPTNWLMPEEHPTFGRRLEQDFPFVLHGHEHQDFVRADASTGHTVISAGACHEWSESKNNGYNFVQLDFEKGTGKVWLRQYDSVGGGWIPRIIANRTDDTGCWTLEHLTPWIEQLSNSVAAKKNFESSVEENIQIEITPKSKVDRAEDYEARYRKAVADKLDYVQLFGIDVPKVSKEYSLTVAYVSLNLSDEDGEIIETEELEDEIDELAATKQNTLPAEQVFDNLDDQKRLLIRGAAGSGKTTLLRWAAVQSARNQAVDQDIAKQKLLSIEPTLSKLDRESKSQCSDNFVDWREKIPFIIRLRDCTKGELPRPGKFPLLLAKELPDPPAHWIDDILNSGRALVMFDGVDEVPQQARDEAMREIRQLVNTYPNNYYVVTTRPEAVERLEFKELGFISARVEPMLPSDRDIFIDRWHEAMEVRLRNWNTPENLRPLAKRLKQRLEANPAVARLTSNPLLCAVVCTLYRARKENLPETPVELCEKLCEMLLDRRDKERLNSEAQKWIDEAYGQLEFRIRKGLLSQLAYHMVGNGLSAIPESQADSQIATALENYQKSNLNATAIRKALVERSGILQESSEQGIEFLHNTLKEFLAAERFVNIGDFQTLADHTSEASWQPVILFAVALPRDGSSFATELIKAILQRTSLNSPSRGRSKRDRLMTAKIRSEQFFFLRCYTNAYQLNDSDINQAFTQLSQQLLPPRSMTDAVALASCGEAIVPYLKNRRGWKATERAACVRTLGLIGDQRAMNLLQEYLDDPTITVAQELASFVDDWSKISVIRESLEEEGRIPISNPTKLRDLNLLFNSIDLIHLSSLDLRRTQVRDVSALAKLTNLTWLDLSNTQVRDISALAKLTNLTNLDLSYTQVRDISALAKLTNLTNLDLFNTQVKDVSALDKLINLTWLDLSNTQISDVSALAKLSNLTNLYLLNTQISDVSALDKLTNLTNLYLSNTQVNDVSALDKLTNLTNLYLSNTQVNDVSALDKLTNLTNLYLSNTQVRDVSALAKLTNLTWLDLSNTQVRDVSALAKLTNLTWLDLRGTQVKDVSALSHVPRVLLNDGENPLFTL